MLTDIYKWSPLALQQVCEQVSVSALFLLMGKLSPQEVKWPFQQNTIGASLVAQQHRTWLRCKSHRKRGFDPWVGNILKRRAQQPTPIFLPGEVHAKSQIRLKRLSTQAPSKGQSWGLSLHLCCSWPPYCTGHEHLSDYHLVLVQNFCLACIHVLFWVP